MKLSYYATFYKNCGLLEDDEVFDNLESAILHGTDLLDSWHKKIHIKAVGYRGKEFHLFTITSGDEDRDRPLTLSE